MAEGIIPPSVEELSQMGIEIPPEGKVVLDIYTDWCQPCKMLSPVLHGLQDEGTIQLVQANLDEKEELAANHHITAVPTMIFFKDGQRVGDIVGNETKDVPLKDLLEDVLCNYKFQLLHDDQPVDDLASFTLQLNSMAVKDGVMVGFSSEGQVREIIEQF
ncbi:MAG TPA: thioredoxin family protein [Candidatus Lokiarchaeia archaeon]|nr:thioredoxin family protein [Candidatus Lokiarchaeia archaeon]